MEVPDSTVVRVISAGRDGAGLHTAVVIDPINCAFPPMTLFTAVDVQIGAFEYDGTEALLKVCKRNPQFGGRAPTPAPDASRGGRLHVGRQQLIEWLVENDEGGIVDGSSWLKSNHPLHKSNRGIRDYNRISRNYYSGIRAYEKELRDWFHKRFLPPGVESTI
jgi:hypothetical protein